MKAPFGGANLDEIREAPLGRLLKRQRTEHPFGVPIRVRASARGDEPSLTLADNGSRVLAGTIGLVQTHDLAGFIIRLDTQDRWNHVVLAGSTGEVYEALPGAGFVRHRNVYVEGIDLVWLEREPLTDADRVARVGAAESRLGLPYNWPAIASIALRGLVHFRLRWLDRWATKRNHLMCSEAVAEIARETGTAWFAADVLTSTITPGDIDFDFRRGGI